MKRRYWLWWTLIAALLAAGPVRAQSDDRVWLVLLQVERPADVAHCYTERFDRGRIALSYDDTDPLADLSDYAFAEDPMIGPDCFIPELKLIYRNYTYIVSLYCTKVIKYQNAAPYTPSNRRVRSDLEMTESVYQYLDDLRREHFGDNAVATGLLQQVVTSEPLEILTEEDIDLDALLEEDSQEDPIDAELEEDARETSVLPDVEELEEELKEDDG